MATTGDGHETTGAGGKSRKRPLRRSIPATPYDRPPTALKNNNPSMLKKLVDPASRLIYAGANRLFDVFRKALPPPSLQGPSEVNQEPQNVSQEKRQSGGSANIAAAPEVSELEQMFQEKTFTRSEVQRLTSLLHSRTTELPSDDSLKKHNDVRDNFHVAISTPVTSKVFKDIASPAELAKSYMRSGPPTHRALIQDSKLIQRTPITPLVQKTANSLRDLEYGFVTPRSQGRSAMYTMARTPYTRSPSFSQKGIRSDYGHGAASTSSKSALGHEGKMALKRRSSVLDDVIGSGGPLRRIRHKANVLSQRDKKELGYTVFQQDGSSLNPILLDETEPKVLAYASVPAKSTQTANKILQHLEKPSPKEKIEKNPVSIQARMREKSPNKLTLDMLHGQALRSLEKVDLPKFLPSPHDIQKPEVQHHARFHESTSQSKDRTDENGSKKFPVPRNMLTSVNGDSTDLLKDKSPIVALTDLPPKVQEEPPQKKHSFQMRASEDSVEIDNDIRDNDNGHVSFPFVKNSKPETSVAGITKTPALPEVTKTHTLVENNNHVLPEVAKVPEQAEVKEAENATSFPNTDVGFLGGSVREQGLGLKIPVSSPSTTITHSSVLPQSALQMEKTSPEKDPSSFSFVKTAENASLVPFFANKPSEVKPNASSDPKTHYSTSVNGNENGIGNGQKSTNIVGESVSSFPVVPTSGSVLFGTAAKNLGAPNMTHASNPTTFSSSAPFPTPTSTSTAIPTGATATSTATTATTASAAIFSTSVPPPVFSFGSASSTAPTTSNAETGNTGNRSPFAITSFSTTNTTTTTSGSGIFGFSSPSATLTTITQSQGSFFNISNGSQTNTQTSSSSTLFGSSAPAFGSSPSFGIGPLDPSSETKSGDSTSGPTTSIFGSTWQQPQKSSGSGSTFSSSPSSSVFNFGASSTPMPSFVTGAAATSSFAGPSVFGNSTPVFGAVATSPNNNSNNQMSMEDSMAEDSVPTNNPVSPFAQAPLGAPGLMFGSAIPTPNPNQTAVSFQFGGQSNQAQPGFMFGSATPTVAPLQFGGQSNQAPPPQNSFLSSSLEFNAGGGGFSLGSVGEKSNRRIVRISKGKNRKK